MEEKRVRKWNAIGPWFFEDYVSWLNDLGAKGYHLKRIRNFRSEFVEDRRRISHYRCAFIDKDMKDVYERYQKGYGWKYVSSQQHMHVYDVTEAIKKSPQGNDVNRFRDPVLYEKKAKHFLWLAVFMLLVVAFMATLSFSGSYYSRYLSDMATNTIFMCTQYTFVAFEHRSLWSYARRRSQKAKAGIPLDYYGDYTGLRRRNRFKVTLTVSFTMVFLTYIGWGIAERHQQPFHPAIPEGELGVLRIEEILEDPDYEWVTSLDWEGYDRENYMISESSLWMPIQVELEQTVMYPGQMWEDGSGVYSPTLRSIHYGALSEWIAKDFYNLYLERRLGEYQPYENEDFDALVAEVSNGSVSFIGRKGKSVYVVRYYGKERPEKILKALVEKVRDE